MPRLDEIGHAGVEHLVELAAVGRAVRLAVGNDGVRLQVLQCAAQQLQAVGRQHVLDHVVAASVVCNAELGHHVGQAERRQAQALQDQLQGQQRP